MAEMKTEGWMNTMSSASDIEKMDDEKMSGDVESHSIDGEKRIESEEHSPHPSTKDEQDREEIDSPFVVSFTENDSSDPYNWSRPKKLYVVISGILMVLNSTIGSALPSGAVEVIAKYWNIRNEEFLVLPVSIYLIGYILGPLVFAPLSEHHGRKVVMICTFIMFTAFVLGSALAPNFASFVVFRLLAGIGASTPVSVIGGIYADIYKTQRERGMAIMAFMAATTWGPICAPLISGFASVSIGWRWVFWIELIMAGITWPFLLTMPETYGPVVLKRKAKKLRQDTGDDRYVPYSNVEEEDLWAIVTRVLTRPVRMFLFEGIVLSTCLFLALEYGVFYMFFQAFEPIFNGVYGFNPGEVGLCFLPIGVGSLIATAIYLWWDWYLARAQKKESPPKWTQKEEYVRLPLACCGGPLIVVGLFWLGWTAKANIPWIVPVLGALPFGTGFLLIFMSLINYIVDAYEIYAASAMGAASASRSIFGVILPFAARPMYASLGIAWACTLLALLSLLMCLVAFAFIKYGAKIRENSEFCKEIKRQKAQADEKQQQLWERQRKASGQEIEQQV